MTFDIDTAYQELSHYFHERIRRDELLARHSAFGVGGPADLWIAVETRNELIGLVNTCVEHRWPLLIVGNGSNSLFADAGVRGIVARVALTSSHLEQEGDKQALLIADAGVNWPSLAYTLSKQGWGGLTFGVGIPGTLGGALVSNAGAHNQEIGEYVSWIEVLDARGADSSEQDYSPCLLRCYQHDELDLSYRSSRFRELPQTSFDPQGRFLVAPHHLIEPPEIVLQLALRLEKAEPGRLSALLDAYKQERARSEPAHPRRGSLFQDLPEGQASHFLTTVGMGGRTCGHARMALDNPNYLLNLGGARANEMVSLIEEAHQRVLERFGLDLPLDVVLLGEWEKREAPQ